MPRFHLLRAGPCCCAVTGYICDGYAANDGSGVGLFGVPRLLSHCALGAWSNFCLVFGGIRDALSRSPVHYG